MSKKHLSSLSDFSIEDLVRNKEYGASVRKLVFGIERSRYGHVYSVNGYRVVCNADPKEISEALRKAKRGSKIQI